MPNATNIRGPYLWPTATKEFFKDSAANVRSKKSRGTWEGPLRTLQAMFPEKRLNEFTESDLVAYLNSNPDWSSNTVRTYRSAFVALFSWAHWRGLIGHDPSVGLKRIVRPRSQAKRLGNWLTQEELARVIRTTIGDDPILLRARVLIMIGFFTGLRIDEILSLRWSDVNLFAKEMLGVGKGGKPFIVAIPVQLLETLLEWQGVYAKGLGRPVTDEPVIVRLRQEGWDGPSLPDWGHKLSYGGARMILVKHGELAGIPGLRPHDMRRTFAKVLKDNGAALDEIQEALRHSSIGTTQTYMEKDPRKAMKVTGGLRIDLEA